MVAGITLKKQEVNRNKEDTIAVITELKKSLKEKAAEVSVLQAKVKELIKIQITSKSAKAEYEILNSKYEDLLIKFNEQSNELEYLRQINAKLKSDNERLIRELEQEKAMFSKFVKETSAERSNINTTLKAIKVKATKVKTEEAIKEEAQQIIKPPLSDYLDKLKWVAADSVVKFDNNRGDMVR